MNLSSVFTKKSKHFGLLSKEATIRFELMNNCFADSRLEPLALRSHIAEGARLELANPFGRQISNLLQYHCANPPNSRCEKT